MYHSRVFIQYVQPSPNISPQPNPDAKPSTKMPFYQVVHSYPLDKAQKTRLAEAITKLHSHTFKTPSLFVNVLFHPEDASNENYYMAGTPRVNATNRIFAMVRTSDKRTKAVFDALAEKLENEWYNIVSGEKITEGKEKGKRKGENDETENQRVAKKLLFVVFHPMIAARENGVTIPGAGEEGNWLKDNMAYFKEQAEGKGDEDFAALIKEVDEREDLKALIK